MFDIFANPINLNSTEMNILSDMIKIFDDNFITLSQEIQQKVFPLFYKNSHLLPPWELKDFIKQEIEALLAFLRTKDNQLATEQGRQAAVAGFDRDLHFEVCSAFKTFYLEHAAEKNVEILCFVDMIIEVYKNHYLLSNMEEYSNRSLKKRDVFFRVSLRIKIRLQDEKRAKEREILDNKIKALEFEGEILKKLANRLVKEIVNPN